MNPSRRKEVNSRSKAVSKASGRSLAGRMPPDQQRRLNHLLDKGREVGLSRAEQAELEGILDEVDRRSFWMLARKMLRRPAMPDSGRGGPKRRAFAGG